jgi:assimilatory nitrate reductase catalytic subunit
MKIGWKRRLGLGTQRENHTYVTDADQGYTASARLAERWVSTTCGYCSVGCGMEVGVRQGKAVAVRGNANHPVNRGKLCPKGLSEHHTLSAPGRALYPMLKRDGQFTRVSWDQALDTFIERVTTTQERYGKESFGVISTGQLVTEEFYALGKLVQLGFKTRHYDGNTTLCMASAVSGYKRSFGSDGPPGCYEDMEQADVVLLLGANIADNHPILCQRLRQKPGQVLIVADPRVTKTAMMADIHLPLKPRSDIALVNALMHVVIAEGLIDQKYVLQNTSGFEELKEHLAKYTPEYAGPITGLSAETIRETALLYGRAASAFIGWTMGVNHSTQGTETVNAINTLALITGKIGRPGSFTVFDYRTMQCDGNTRGWLRLRSSRIQKIRERRGSRRTSTLVEYRHGGDSESERFGLSGHHRSSFGEAYSSALDHCYEPNGLVSKCGCIETSVQQSGFPGGAGRLSSNTDERSSASGIAGRDLG